MKRRKSAELKSMAREALCGNYATFIGATLIYGVISMLLEWIPTFIIPTNSSYLMVALRYVISFLIQLIVVVLASGLSKLALNISRSQQIGIGDLFHAFRHHPDRFLILALIFSFISTICQIPSYLVPYMNDLNSVSVLAKLQALTWMSLLSLAGVTVSTILTLAFSMSTMLLVDYENISAIEALKESISMMRGNKWRYFYIMILSFLGLSFLSVLGLCIPLLWVAPYMNVTEAFFYRELNKELP